MPGQPFIHAFFDEPTNTASYIVADAEPRLLPPSIQVNIRAGKFPSAHVNGVSYLTIPVKFKNAEARLA